MEDTEPQGLVAALERVATRAIDRTTEVITTVIFSIRPPPEPDPETRLVEALIAATTPVLAMFLQQRWREREERNREDREPERPNVNAGLKERPISREELFSRSAEGANGRRILRECPHDFDTIEDGEHVTVFFCLPDGVDPTTIRVGIHEHGLLVVASGDRLKGWAGRPFDDKGEPVAFEVKVVLADTAYATHFQGIYAIRRDEFAFDRIIAVYKAPSVMILLRACRRGNRLQQNAPDPP
jgi:hypothetical protein